jgi:Nucleotide-diphospho-sugar transferase
VFRDAAKSVEQFLAEENDNALIYASADCMSEQICWKKNELNAGFLVVKNTPKTFELLDAWIKAPETALCREWKYTHPREQACLNELQKSQYANEIKILPRDKRVGTHDGNWVVHLAGVKDSTREHYFTQMINGNDPVLVTNTVGSLTFLASHKAAIVTGMLVAVILVVWLVVWRVAKR